MRRTCPGSQLPPEGKGLLMLGRRKARGICSRCRGVYALRVDGTLLVHRA